MGRDTTAPREGSPGRKQAVDVASPHQGSTRLTGPSILWVELARLDDDAWFAEHPREEWRVRRRIVGEFGDLESILSPSAHVVVHQLQCGERYRSPLPTIDAHAGVFDAGECAA